MLSFYLLFWNYLHSIQIIPKLSCFYIFVFPFEHICIFIIFVFFVIW